MKKRCMFRVEDGSVMAVTLCMLVFLTLLGIAATTTSEGEIRIAGNDKVSKQNFYLAECASMTGAQTLNDESDYVALKGHSYAWLHLDAPPDPDIHGATNWDPDLSPPNSAQVPDSHEANRYLVVDEGPAPGGSMDMMSSGTVTTHDLTIFGRSARTNEESLVEVGYRKRF